MGRLLPLLLIADLAVIAVTLVDCLASERHEVRLLPRGVWILLITIASPIGPIAWLTAGRPEPITALRRPGTPTHRTSGPDDDPEFLRELSTRRVRPEDEELLRRLEAEFGGRDQQPGRPEDRRPPGPADLRPPRRRHPSGKDEDPRRRHPSGKDIDDDRGADPTET